MKGKPKPKSEPQRLKGWKEIAEFLGEPRSVVERWGSQGMPLRREGRYVTISPEELNAWLGKQAGKPVHVVTEDTDLIAELNRVNESSRGKPDPDAKNPKSFRVARRGALLKQIRQRRSSRELIITDLRGLICISVRSLSGTQMVSHTPAGVAVATRHRLQIADIHGMNESRCGSAGNNRLVGFGLRQYGVACVATLGNDLAVGAYMLSVVAAETSGKVIMANIIGVRAPIDLHVGKDAGGVNVLDFCDCALHFRTAGRVLLRIFCGIKL